ncbi:leucine-rich repeat-containing protein 74B [Patella vulgata]|uniref:leucine-rich repeat-containing protein 74B n=1 Tax=Patella vulgata TaxID=6465 RepID=UPI0021807A02|nr:leucine-rich repeat-containing protein 74B [Patella vulgata]
MEAQERPKTIEGYYFTGVLKSQKQILFERQITGIRSNSSGRRTVARKIKPDDKDDNLESVTMTSDITSFGDREDTLLDDVLHAPVEDEKLDNLPVKLDTVDIQKKLYRRECDKLGVIPIGVYMRNPVQPQLILKHYSMGPDGAKALAIPLMLDSNIVCLDLEGNDINATGMVAMAEMLAESVTIKELNLSRNNLGHRGALSVKSLLRKNRLIDTLYLSGNGFTDVDTTTFADIIKESKTLKKLVLSHNGFGDGSGTLFGNAIIVNENMEYLDLSWNKLRGRSAAELCLGLKENIGLKYFNIAYNGCGKHGATAVAMALGVNSTLRELDLTDNRLTDVYVLAVIRELSNNETLKILRIGENLITGKGCLDILRLFLKAENSVLEILDLKNTNVTKEFLEEMKMLPSIRTPSPVILHGSCPSAKQIPMHTS